MLFNRFPLKLLFVFNIVYVHFTNKHDVKGDFEVGESSQGGQHGPDNEAHFNRAFQKAPLVVKELVLWTNLEDMEKVGQKIVAQIEAVLLLNPPYKIPYTTDDGTIQYNHNPVEDEWDKFVDTLEDHNDYRVYPVSDEDKTLLRTLMTNGPDEEKMVDKFKEILKKTNRFAIELTRDIEERNDISNVSAFNDLVRQGLEKRNMEMSVFEKAISEMELLLRTSCPKSYSWFHTIYLLNALFFSELRYIANVNIMKLMEILKELPKSERQPEFVDRIMNAKELKKMEQLAHFASIARDFYKQYFEIEFKHSLWSWVTDENGKSKRENAGWNERAAMAIFEEKEQLNEEIIRLKEEFKKEIQQGNEKVDISFVSGQEKTQQN